MTTAATRAQGGFHAFGREIAMVISKPDADSRPRHLDRKPDQLRLPRALQGFNIRASALEHRQESLRENLPMLLRFAFLAFCAILRLALSRRWGRREAS